MKSKISDSPKNPLEGLLTDGITIMSGGFGLSGNPESRIPVIRASGVKNLSFISNNAGGHGGLIIMCIGVGQDLPLAIERV